MGQTLAQVGEFGLIDRLHNIIENEGITPPLNLLGIGDDCAAFSPSPGYEILVTCDCMVENRHYLSRFMSSHDVGRRAMALNISDVGAMGGRPRYALISLGLRADTPLVDLIAVYRGFLAELNPLGAVIIGGNVTKSTDANFIDITLIGEVEKGKMVRRSTAKPGDAILVTGYPGQSAAGLSILLKAENMKGLDENPLVRAYQRPTHRALEGRAVGVAQTAHAMIDTSDGLLGDLGHICRESGVGALLHEKQLPMSTALLEYIRESGRNPLDFVLGESDDYELLITCAPEQVSGIRETIQGIRDIPVTKIGDITAHQERIELAGSDGAPRIVKGSGWDHFSK
jgi:thiamine-monophosphate kinase